MKDKELSIVNMETGEKLNLATSPAKDISDALLVLDEKQKMLTKIIKQSKKYLEENRMGNAAIAPDEEAALTFGDWKIRITNRYKRVAPKVEDLPEEIRNKYIDCKKFIEETDEHFGQETLTQFATWTRPRL